MVFVRPGKGALWEIRETQQTSAGPRSRTLTTFDRLTPKVIERARDRSLKTVEIKDLQQAAVKVGAPVTTSEADDAARSLLTALASGSQLNSFLSQLITGMLDTDGQSISDTARDAITWMNTTAEDRAAALHDLLLLADQLPVRQRECRFPPLKRRTGE